MTKHKQIIKYLFIALLTILSACKGTTYDAIYPTLSDGKYDSEFPYRNCSEQLEDIASSMLKLDVLVFYKTYTFAAKNKISMDMVRQAGNKLSELAVATDVFSESVGGTALAIYHSNARIAFLTCAHIIDYPDTVVTYYPYPDNHFIQVMGIRARQQNSIAGTPPGGELEILAMDKKNDIALLGKEVLGENQQGPALFSFPMGNSEELEWGSFVYIMGFPLGHEMITRGIVSDPKRIRKGSFLIDAVFNQGFSGGPVIAVRDGVPNFEMVGMVKSSAALQRHYLVPASEDPQSEINFLEPYTGEVKIKSEKDIKYGITFSVTTEYLRSFYKKHQSHLEEKGYYLDDFFSKKD